MTPRGLGRRMIPDACGSSWTLLTWNILADRLAQGSFVRSPPDALTWEARFERILAEIEGVRGLTDPPDLVCLQEVDRYADLAPRLAALGYQGTFAPKAPGRDGCCLLARSGRAELLSSEVVRYEHADGRPATQLAILARVRLGERELCVVTTHLKAKAENEAIRSAQARQLVATVRRLADGAPAVIAGDFNDVPGSRTYRALAEGELLLGDAYADLGLEDRWTTWKVRETGEVRRTIDYVWYSRQGLRPTSCLSIPADDQVGPGRLPSWQYPSDHLSLVVGFELT